MAAATASCKDAAVSSPGKANPAQFLCLTILGYRRPDLTETQYRDHMVNVSASLTKDLMIKYGVKRWTMIHNTDESRALFSQIMDHQMANVADYDCFSQVVFRDIASYKAMKQDPWYKQHLQGDHEKFADTRRSKMTIGWITEFVRDGEVVSEPHDDDFRPAPKP